MHHIVIVKPKFSSKNECIHNLISNVLPMPITMPNEAYKYLQCILMQMQSWP